MKVKYSLSFFFFFSSALVSITSWEIHLSPWSSTFFYISSLIAPVCLLVLCMKNKLKRSRRFAASANEPYFKEDTNYQLLLYYYFYEAFPISHSCGVIYSNMCPVTNQLLSESLLLFNLEEVPWLSPWLCLPQDKLLSQQLFRPRPMQHGQLRLGSGVLRVWGLLERRRLQHPVLQG